MRVFGIFLPPLRPGEGNLLRKRFASGAAICPKCHEPTAIKFGFTKEITHTDANNIIVDFSGNTRSSDHFAMYVAEAWPEPQKPRIPEHLDARVEQLLVQAEHAYAKRHADMAVIMYGQTLDAALKRHFEAKGTLNERIKSLVSRHVLPTTIGDWATTVRIIRNEAVHDDGPMTETDMEMTRNFTDAFLRYAVTLPKEIEIRRKLTEPADGA
ncbi:DUF4145 domain-containing protein [Methylobacterium platani]|uniref:DUF4145 domain-containing protein n=2 Tax=Methylobacterium platani TaxID=427683 RepID=UPI0018D32090|nr:DUF4145 domain-containing protein [Methylobacterium platani]